MAVGPVALVRTGVLSPFLQFFDDIGSHYEAHLERAHLSPQLLNRKDALVPLRQVLAFVEYAAHREGVPHLGLTVARRAGVACLADLMQIVSTAATLRTAIDRLIDFIGLISSAERICLKIRSNKACLCHELALGGGSMSRNGDEFTLVLLVDFVRLAAGPQWRPSTVWIPASEAPLRTSYEALMEAPVLLATNGWGVGFETELLARPLRYCMQRLSDGADAIERLQASAPAKDFTDSLRQAIASFLPRGNPHICTAAEAAGLTTRTLQRRLNEAGYSYSHLLEEVRQEQARQLLEQTDAKVVDVAFELGYTDAANFTRAFRRWNGVPPQQVRGRGAGRGA